MTRRLPMVLAYLLSASVLARPTATLEDLRALAVQKSWVELLERAEEIPPASRSDTWRALVTEAATAEVESATALDDKDPFATVRKARALGQRYAFLAKAPGFSSARDARGLKDLERCLKSERSGCMDTYRELAGDASTETTLQAARLVKRGHFAYVAMPLFASAMRGGKETGACKDEELAEAVLAALDLPATDARAGDARKVAFDWCWPALGARLKAATVGASSYFLANTCQPMRTRNALTELQDDLCRDGGL
ncbi:hypothetical protein LY474_32850 [Myxococcus stipitatus]|uniref:hypothetical protein n=1 Tax=Myxococcus stipitatus TaxID=83455 RepID=UPI001F24B5B0|nr:hypothetical protein [Myxococcus stipitatus]MCE9672608.1 hypothetical protein [Myxococcus stipitatus]